MLRDKLLRSLKHLKVPPRDHAVLKLLPLIYVAWSDGNMEGVQKERIERLALEHYDLSERGMAVLARWLRAPPSHDYITEGLHDLYRLAMARDDSITDVDELPSLVSYAEAIARTTADALDQPEAVTAEEDVALQEIARELHVEHGQSWARLLREISPAPLSSPEPTSSARV